SAVPEREQELKKTVSRVSEMLGLKQITDLSEQSEKVDQGFWPVWQKASAQQLHEEFQRYLAFRYLKKEIKDTVFGYGPLEDLLRVPNISEIMVVDRDHIYIEK